jgi:multidrug efflux pump subunit AcrB
MYAYYGLFYCCVLKKFWCQLPEDGKINKAYTCMSYVKDSMHKLQNSAFVGVTSVFHFVITHRINNVKVKSQDSQNTREE